MFQFNNILRMTLPVASLLDLDGCISYISSQSNFSWSESGSLAGELLTAGLEHVLYVIYIL